MELHHAAILGALQGLTEILPISSSAHLILVPWLFRWPESGLTFDVALHLGTLIALILYFWRDIVTMAGDFTATLRDGKFDTPQRRLPWYIIAGSIPAAIAGKTLEGPVEDLFRANPTLIATMLIAFGLLLFAADRFGAKRRGIATISLQAVVIIGLAQCLALVPGVSRSGITITAALLLGFDRGSAARFSFLLSLPIVAGAALLKLGHLAKDGIPAGETLPLLIGVASSALFGYFSVFFLLKYVQRHSIAPFVWYRLVAGAGVLLAIFVGH